jgi:hypothetical protein
MRYAELRPRIRTGDVLLFSRLTLRHVLARRASLGGYLGNTAIALKQRAANSRADGCWEFVHCGMAVRNYTTGEVLLAEYTAGQRGPGLRQLSLRVRDYPGAVLHLPLYPHVAVADARMQTWLDRHRLDAYNYAGLLFPCSTLLSGWQRAGRMFCSEAVVSALQYCGALPYDQYVWAGDHKARVSIQPHAYSPDEVAGLRRILDWDNAVEVEP